MYIKEVIERVGTYYPSEYDEKEMYPWCDEVSSMLATEDRCIFREINLTADKNSAVTLPDGVSFESIVAIYKGDKEIKKSTLTLNGNTLLVGGDVRIVYLAPYESVRVVRYEGEAEIWDNTIRIHDDCFRVGDVVVLETSSGERVVTVTKTAYEAESQCPYILTVTYDKPLAGLGTTSVIMTRKITDKTLCDAPYDIMYVDYLMGKIALFQRDYQMYSQFMTSFNSRLDAYKRWLVNHMPQSGGNLHGWWS